MVSMGGGCEGVVDGVEARNLTIEGWATLCGMDDLSSIKFSSGSSPLQVILRELSCTEIWGKAGVLNLLGAAVELMMMSALSVLSLDGKLLVHPEWKILQTLTNSGWNTSWARGYKEVQCAYQVEDSSKTNHGQKKGRAGSSPRLLVNGLLWKTNDESGTPRSQSRWKTSWAKKDDKEDECASRVVDSSNTNQWGKKEAGSSPPSLGKWAAMEN
ncbi:hypothetical protein Tco_0729812 [Tanacetum coccineum]|uniref:Uncharacterized protein n=1 Tax=Tanacetum coccineum TaxID=301880 RepID=A0ABQ4YR74_9ASTR